MFDFLTRYFKDIAEIANQIDLDVIESLVNNLAALRERKGRLFFLGVGGSAANCSHAVNDFRKLCEIEAYAPTDNISELTARTNDEGWATSFSSWLKVSQANKNDAIFIMSVGGGDQVNNVSPNIVSAIDEAKKRQLRIYGIVGPRGGYTKQEGDLVLVVPSIRDECITPHVESFQAVIWHSIVSHPKLQCKVAKWESIMMQTV